MKYAAFFVCLSTLISPWNAIGADAIELRFRHFDKNRDGILSGDELKAAPILQKLDSLKDGPLTLEEARRILAKFKGGTAQLDNSSPSENGVGGSKTTESLTETAQILKGTDFGVGRRVADFPLKTLAGEDTQLSSLSGNKTVVVALFDSRCPISNKNGAELARIENDYSNKGVAFLLIPTPVDAKPEQVRHFIDSFGLRATVVSDPNQNLQKSLSAKTTTEVFVLDSTRTLIYRGALNDQYGLGYNKENASHHYLKEALDSVLNRTPLAVRATSAPGCALDLPAPLTAVAKPLTYHSDISRILQTNCLECHHTNGIAPFSLEKYDDVLEHAAMIRKQVERGVMPPWFAAPNPAHVWLNDRSLSEKDKNDLLSWLKSERPLGSPEDAPLPLSFNDEWSIGTPDAVVEMPKAIAVKAEGTMPYQYSVIETSFPEDRWVQAYEIIPKARSVVHHVIVSMHEKNAPLTNANAAAGFWAAYVPGNSLRKMPDGFAKRLPAGARLRLQIHYTPNGQAVEDKIKIGLIFAKTPPKYEIHVSSLVNPRLQIPAGVPNHEEITLKKVPEPMILTGYMAHMHVRGKSFKYEVSSLGGPMETLLDLPRYDFNWQLQYIHAQPKFIPAGSTLKITAVFDNSSANPANPDPSKVVRWGEQTNDEMMIGYFEYYSPAGRR